MSSNKVNVTADEESKSIYTISLDDIDVNLLPFDNVMNRCEANNIKPLWSKNNLKIRRDNVYYQVEVVAKEINDGIVSSNHELKDAHNIYNTYKKKKRADVAVQTETQIKSNEAMNLNMYIKILNSINESSQILSITVQNDSLIEIKTPDGGLRLTTDNFHGFFRVGDCIQCRTCRIMVDDEYAHILSMKHLMLILKPINAAQGVRQVDDLFSHCILCNEIIENIDLHAQCSEQHNPLLKNAFTPTKSINNKTFPQDSKSKPSLEPKIVISEFFCDECLKEIPSIDIELHMNSDEHLNKQANRNKKKFNQNAHKNKAQRSPYKSANNYNFHSTVAAYVHQRTDDEKLTALEIQNDKLKKETEVLRQKYHGLFEKMTCSHDIIIKKKNKLLCYVCKVTFNNTNYDLIMHLSNELHMCLYVEFLNYNLIRPRILDYYCDACCRIVSRCSIVYHTESYEHKHMCSIVKKHFEATRNMPRHGRVVSKKDSSVLMYVTSSIVLLPIIAGFIYFNRRFF